MTARRARGEGTIDQDRHGRWRVRLDLGRGPKGQRLRRYVYADSRAEASRKLRELIRQREDGGLLPGRSPTVGSFLNQWLEATKPNVSYNTWKRYEGLVRGHLIPGLGRLRLEKLTAGDVEVFMASRLALGLAPRSVHHLRAVLRTALNRGIRWGVVQRNAAALADPVRINRGEYQVLNPEQARRLLASVQGDRLEALWTTALALGLRQGEALGLTWSDIDWTAGLLNVRHSLQWRKTDPKRPAQPVLVEPKTQGSRRTLTLPRTVLSVLREHRTRQLEERLLAGAIWQEQNLIFCSQHGKPLQATYVLVLFRRALKQAGLPRMRFHELRHSAASLLIAQGIGLKQVSDLLGHSSVSITGDIYAQAFASGRREVADAIDQALSRQTASD